MDAALGGIPAFAASTVEPKASQLSRIVIHFDQRGMGSDRSTERFIAKSLASERLTAVLTADKWPRGAGRNFAATRLDDPANAAEAPSTASAAQPYPSPEVHLWA